MPFTPRQRQALDRRTTPSSRQRLATRFRAKSDQPTGDKPGLNPVKPGAGKAKEPPALRPKAIGRPAEPDSIYQGRVDIAERKGQERLDQLEGREQAVKHDFGIDDPTNPFSRAEGLKRMFLAKYRGQSAGLAAQGHLYSGQHERALSRTRMEEAEARSSLRSAYEAAIGNIGAERAGVKVATEEERAQAFEDWLARAPESEAPASQLDANGASPSSNAMFRTDGPAPTTAQLNRINPALASPQAKVGGTRSGFPGGGKGPKSNVKFPKKKVVKKKGGR